MTEKHEETLKELLWAEGTRKITPVIREALSAALDELDRLRDEVRKLRGEK